MSGLVALVVALPVAACLLWLRSVVALTLAGWFLVPLVPGLVLPSTAATLGLLLLIEFVWHHDSPDEGGDKDPWAEVARAVIRGVGHPLLVLALGALVRWAS